MRQNTIEYTSKVLRQIHRLEDKDSAMIFKACRALEDFPNCVNIKKLARHAYEYRLKVGNFRVFFNFKGIPRIVYVEEVKSVMNRLINEVQIIHDQQNHPAFVVLPIDQYQMLIDADSRLGIPAEAAENAILNHLSAAKAWRLYLELTQEEVAQRMGITQASYCRLENQKKIRQSSRIKVAKALHIDESQLDF